MDMTISKLDVEVAKIDTKFSPGKYIGDKSTLDFFIRYCSPQAAEIEGEGIAVCIHRYQPDRIGRNGLAVLEKTYPFSFEGLESARRDGLIVVKDLYNLPKDIQVVEAQNFPRLIPNINTDYNKIYRADMIHVLQLISKKEN